jgi:dephospho-CoA kinase
METNEELVLSIKNLFGKESYIKGKLNRSYIANLVFNNPSKLEQLNALVHPATIVAANNWMQQQKTPYIIKEAALLFEAGTAANLDFIIGVYAPQHLRIQRVMERDNATQEQTLARMERQMNEEAKMKLCDFMLVNDEEQLLIPQVLGLHEKFLQMTGG